MPTKSDDEIRESIRNYEESLPESERNPNVQEDVERLIERASQPLPSAPETPPRRDGYSDTQTRSHTAEDTSDSHSDTSHPKNVWADPKSLR